MTFGDMNIDRLHIHGGGLFQSARDRFLHTLLNFTPVTEPRTIVDAGCGAGAALQALCESSPAKRLVGCDPSLAAVKYARLELPETVHLFVADQQRLPLRSHCQDLVICSEGLEHLPQADEALNELKRVSRGWILLRTLREPGFRLLLTLTVPAHAGSKSGQPQLWSPSGFVRFVRRRFERARATTSIVS